MAIIPIPTTRTSDMLMSRRLLTQLQSDQQSLLKIQTQLSTGRRIFAPSDDAPAAQRAIVLQRLLEQKAQVQTNRDASQSFLTASETALGEVGSLIADVRSIILGVSGTAVSDSERQTAIAQVERALEQLSSIANQQFRGRHLFGGAKTGGQPFDTSGEYVVYNGNERHLPSLADVALLVNSNLHGEEVFGAISAEVRSSVDFNPILTLDTRLADLRGGSGIDEGSFAISDGDSVSIIDISSAETIGDVVRLLESNPPAGRTIAAQVTSTGLTIEIDAGGGGNLTVAEVGGGTTAASLGILNTLGTGTAPLVGDDLDPRLRSTTPLANILGGTLDLASGIQVASGDEFFNISFAGAETVEDLLNILNSSDAHLLAEINADGTGINVRSRRSGADFSIGENGGQTATQLGIRTFTASTALASLNHGRGIAPAASGGDFTIRRTDGVEIAIDISSATTVQDVLDLINNHASNQDPATSVVARLAAVGGGIELVDDNPLGTTTLRVTQHHPSFAAAGLGLVPVGQSQADAQSPGVLQGRDVNPRETKGIFNSLTRLLHALEADDQQELERGVALLDDDFDRITFARSEIGARQQGLDMLGRRLEDESIELQRSLSGEIDVDLVEAITNLTERQAAFQASLQTMSQTFNLTLLDFL